MLALLLTLLSCPQPQGPIRIGVIAVDRPDAGDAHFLGAVRLAVAACNAKGGIGGAKVELVVEGATTPAETTAAVGRLDAAAVTAIVAPPEPRLADVARRSAQGKVPCASFVPSAAAIARTLDTLLAQTFRMQRIGLVHDTGKESRELAKLLQKGGLQAPTEVLFELDLAASPKALQKQLDKEHPELLVVDGEPEAVATFLQKTLAEHRLPVVLAPRAYGSAVARAGRDLYVITGQSLASVVDASGLRADFEKVHGVPGYGAAEGFEAAHWVLRAIAAAANERPAINASMSRVTVEGARGRLTIDKATGALEPPMAVWRLQGGKLLPYLPAAVGVDADGNRTTTAASGSTTGPDVKTGAPFGAFRSRQFAIEEGAQVVHCIWADDGAFANADSDLVELGLSTHGVEPLLDHIVRDEIMARVLAIVAPKYGRKDDGAAVPGKSLRICFVAHVPDPAHKKLKLWQARFGGDHPDAGGEAFGTFCRVYTTFIRRTIFQKNAVRPPLTAADLELLDGTYKFGTDLAKDKRSELLRALINSYAGSMALTLAHEVGHLCGLDHVTDDPKEIMNVDEGAGIDYRDGHFAAYCWGRLVKKLGLAGDKR